MIILTDQQINLLEKKLPIKVFKVLLDQYTEALCYQNDIDLLSATYIYNEDHQEGWNDAIGYIMFTLWEKNKDNP